MENIVEAIKRLFPKEYLNHIKEINLEELKSVKLKDADKILFLIFASKSSLLLTFLRGKRLFYAKPFLIFYISQIPNAISK